ncbi:MAG: hemerythrin domain-containing protein [Ferruginibacter sp.]|nr:hemerythrin domain-containing protein [Chitinophagaceae bacterium]
MNEIKPLKRSFQLQPLSREHHDGLLFVWKIRQGLQNNTGMETLQQFTHWYCKQHISPHFYQEEKILLPFFSPSDPLAVKMKEDHDYIRELILSIEQEPDRDDFTRLTNLIDAHIRFEEREFFQYLEENLSEQELTEVYEKLEKHPVACKEEWKNIFWLKKEPGNGK